MVTTTTKFKTKQNKTKLAPWAESYDKLRQCMKKQRRHFADKVPYCQSYGFSCSLLWMWELDHKEDWVVKNWCSWVVAPEKTLESPLDFKEINSVNPKRNQPWIILGRTDAEAESPILWPPDVKNWLIGKYPNFLKDWRQKEKGSAEDRKVGWHHWLNGHEVEQILGDSGRQRNLERCSSWTHRVKPNLVTEKQQHQIYLAFIPISDKLKVVWKQTIIKC